MPPWARASHLPIQQVRVDLFPEDDDEEPDVEGDGGFENVSADEELFADSSDSTDDLSNTSRRCCLGVDQTFFFA